MRRHIGKESARDAALARFAPKLHPGKSTSLARSGGLIPCPAGIAVLLLCLQLKQFSLGFTLVVCFGIGLAITMVSAGVLAALGLRHIERRWSGFSRDARQAADASAM